MRMAPARGAWSNISRYPSCPVARQDESRYGATLKCPSPGPTNLVVQCDQAEYVRIVRKLLHISPSGLSAAFACIWGSGWVLPPLATHLSTESVGRLKMPY